MTETITGRFLVSFEGDDQREMDDLEYYSRCIPLEGTKCRSEVKENILHLLNRVVTLTPKMAKVFLKCPLAQASRLLQQLKKDGIVIEPIKNHYQFADHETMGSLRGNVDLAKYREWYEGRGDVHAVWERKQRMIDLLDNKHFDSLHKAGANDP